MEVPLDLVKEGTYFLVKDGPLKGQIVKSMFSPKLNFIRVKNIKGEIVDIYYCANNLEPAVETTNTPNGTTAFLVPKQVWEPLNYNLKWGDKVIYKNEIYIFLCYRPNNQIEIIQQGTNKHYTVSMEGIIEA